MQEENKKKQDKIKNLKLQLILKNKIEENKKKLQLILKNMQEENKKKQDKIKNLKLHT